jgi:hypothetical protein
MPKRARPICLTTSRSPVLGHLWRSFPGEESETPSIRPSISMVGPSFPQNKSNQKAEEV